MSHVALVDRGYVVATWLNHTIDEVDASRVTGTLVQTEKPVFEGQAYRDGRFWIAPPRPTADEIRAEADRRTHSVFPPALQEQLAARGGEFAASMFRYTLGVAQKAAEFLSLDAAPADFRDDQHWPAIPDLSLAPVPVVSAPPVPIQGSTSPVEVRVVLEREAQRQEMAPVRVIEHTPAAPDRVERRPDAVLHPVEAAPDLLSARVRALADLCRITDDNLSRQPAETQSAWAQRMAEIAVSRVCSADLDGIPAARAEVAALIEGA